MTLASESTQMSRPIAAYLFKMKIDLKTSRSAPSPQALPLKPCLLSRESYLDAAF